MKYICVLTLSEGDREESRNNIENNNTVSDSGERVYILTLYAFCCKKCVDQQKYNNVTTICKNRYSLG